MSDDRAAELRDRNAAIYATIRDLGATRARLPFSGGHDEGGAEQIHLFDGDRELELDIDPDLELWEQLSAPIYDEYGSFAGQYHVSGELRIDAVAETLTVETLEGADDFRAYCAAEEQGWRATQGSASAPPKRSLVARLFGRR